MGRRTRPGADVSIALDRREGTYSAVADATSFPTASVVKLFIADDVLFREARAEHELTPEEHDLIGRMLERSDDDAANTLWNEYGGPEIVEDVVGRYHLTATTTPYDDNWWNTETTPADLVDYYAGLLDGRGGLDDGRRTEDPHAPACLERHLTEGYDQRFGLPDGLGAETTLAVKQGWMCCIGRRLDPRVDGHRRRGRAATCWSSSPGGPRLRRRRRRLPRHVPDCGGGRRQRGPRPRDRHRRRANGVPLQRIA
ncbi:hypothetical protein GS444_18950 [Rhodococcus hoagii]|nr:hypothetical protein [Prescottella equi]